MSKRSITGTRIRRAVAATALGLLALGGLTAVAGVSALNHDGKPDSVAVGASDWLPDYPLDAPVGADYYQGKAPYSVGVQGDADAWADAIKGSFAR